jgi:hypothetical protein
MLMDDLGVNHGETNYAVIRQWCNQLTVLPSKVEASRAGQWVPVGERLPDNMEPVLVNWGTEMCRVGTWRKERWWQEREYGKGFVCWFTATPLQDGAVHWMPLPAAPAAIAAERGEVK